MNINLNIHIDPDVLDGSCSEIVKLLKNKKKVEHNTVTEESWNSGWNKRAVIMTCNACGSSAKEHAPHTGEARDKALKTLTGYCKGKNCNRVT